MNVNEFKAWLSRNEGTGGKRPKQDPFNKAMKGSERNPRAPEYPCMDVEEYHRYPAYKDERKKDDDDKKQDNNQNQDNGSRNASRSSQNATNLAQNVVRNVVPKVVLVVAGSVVVVAGYTEMKAKEAQAAVTTTSWVWNDDGSASLTFLNKDGQKVREVPAVVTTTEEAATCTKEGLKTYTATVEDSGTTYTDSRDETLAPLGHAFDEGTETEIDGNPSIVYECTRCHEQFIVTIEKGEVDPTAPEYLAHWSWSEDHLSCDVELADMFGHVVKSGPAEVNVSIVDATCTKEGATVYTASIIENEETYSTTYSEPIAALGHAFDEGTETMIEGKPAIVYECTRCHETFTIIIDPQEDEGDEGEGEATHIHHGMFDKATHLYEECMHCHEHHHIH